MANTVATDWQTKPFTDIIITDWPNCPADYPKTVFSRYFYGARLGCDCLGVADKWIDHSNTMIYDKKCSINETLAGCHNSPPI